MQRQEILEHYRRLRAISARHHGGALDCLARQTILEQAKHLGLAYGHTLVAASEEEMTLVFDLAIHTAKPGRSRAIDRYAKSAALAADSDEARMLQAMCAARFSIWRIERHHETAGVVVTDVARGSETWLIDEGLTVSGQPGLTFASRLSRPAAFAMTCGVVVPVDAELVSDAWFGSPAWLQHAGLGQAADEPRFAAAIYRSALDFGIMESVVFQEPALAS